MTSEKQKLYKMIQTFVEPRRWSRFDTGKPVSERLMNANRNEETIGLVKKGHLLRCIVVDVHFNGTPSSSRLESDTFSTSPEPEIGTSTLPKVARPSLYKVILLNDDFTPMEFVISVLKKFFNKSDGEAQRVMLQVHQDGAAVAGVYTFEVAETKVYLVNEFSRRHKFPLKCIMEKEADDESAV